MADTYAIVAGLIQFDPRERNVNGKVVRDVTVKAIGTQKLVRITLWPEHANTNVAKGDFVVADGKFSSSMGQAGDGSPREYLNLSANVLVVVPSVPKLDREVVSSSSSAAKADDSVPF